MLLVNSQFATGSDFMVDAIKALCDQHNTTIKSLERSLGFGNGTIARWDESSPAINKVLKVAEYFNVDVYTVIYGEKQKKPAGMEADGQVAEIINLFSQLTPDNQDLFLAQLRAVVAAQHKQQQLRGQAD